MSTNPKSIYNEFIRDNLPVGITYDEVRAQYVTGNGKRFPTYLQAKWYLDYITKFGYSPVFSVASLFSDGETGVWYDPSDLSTLFQDAAGTTPVTTPGQTVGLMLDKSKGLTLGPELVTNGTFDSDTSGWIERTPAATNVFWNAGALSVTSSSISANVVYQVIPTTTGKSYLFSLETVGANTEVVVFDGNDLWSTELTTRSSGANTALDLVFTAISAETSVSFRTGQVSVQATVDNISVKELPGFHVTQPTAAARPTYGIVPETGRRNLLGYTEQFDNASWAKSGVTVSTNAATAPNGETTADKVTPSTSNATHFLRQSNPIVPDDVRTISIYAKADGYDYLQVIGGPTNAAYANFELTGSGSVTASNSLTTSITSVGDGWYRCTATQVSEDTAAFGFQIYVQNSSSAVKSAAFAGDGTSGIYIWGAQLELGSTVTAYQKVTTEFDVTEAGVTSLGYLSFDGVDDSMVTPTITPGIDKVQVFAGARRLSDPQAVFAEFSAVVNNNPGSFIVGSPGTAFSSNYYWGSRGSAALKGVLTANTFINPRTDVISGLGDIAADFQVFRVNGTQVAENTADQGTGNYLAYPLYIGSRAGTSLHFNGQIYSFITRFGANLEVAQIESTEAYVAGKTGVDL